MHGGRANGSVGGYSNVFHQARWHRALLRRRTERQRRDRGRLQRRARTRRRQRGRPQPTAGTGAYWLVYDNQFNNIAGANMSSTIIGDYPKTAFDARTHQLPRSSLTVFNSAQAHLDLTDGTAEWLVRVLSGGGLDVTPLAGAHHVVTVPELSANGGLSGASLSINPSSAGHRLYDDGGGRLAFEVGSKEKMGLRHVFSDGLEPRVKPVAANRWHERRRRPAQRNGRDRDCDSWLPGTADDAGVGSRAVYGWSVRRRFQLPLRLHGAGHLEARGLDAVRFAGADQRGTLVKAICRGRRHARNGRGRVPMRLGFTLTFGTPKTHPADCLISSPTGTAYKSYKTSSTALVVSNAAVTGATFTYHCRAN